MFAIMLQNLAMASAMVTATVTVHFFGLIGLLHFLRRRGARFRAHESIVGQGALVLIMVFGVFAIHTIEIWLYAVVYTALKAAPDFETALYFSTVTFASLGYGDIVLSREWRLFGAIEAANGVILFAWSTAFLLSVMARLRALEHDWRAH
ncbi:MAG: potassium channel family protein [Pseudomonadota bacterium]